MLDPFFYLGCNAETPYYVAREQQLRTQPVLSQRLISTFIICYLNMLYLRRAVVQW